MAGSVEGGRAAAATNKRKYGKNFYRVLGAKGGAISRGGGFAAGKAGRERAVYWGKVGGRKSRRGKK